jgi:hypothetical protein
MCFMHRVSVSILCPLGQPKKSHRPRASNRIMVATWHPYRLLRFRNRPPLDSFPSWRHSRRTVLAVQGPLRRAYRRALDSSGPL